MTAKALVGLVASAALAALTPGLVLAQSTSPIDTLQPGEWYEAPNSKIRSVLPNPLPQLGYGNPTSIILAWNGAAYDTRRDQFVIAAAGGHADYAGNEVYVFSMATLAWQRITDPSPTTAFGSPSSAVNPDGTPVSVHNYDGTTYLPNVDRVFLHGGSRWWDGNGVQTTWFFDTDARRWERKIDMPSFLGTSTAYDPVTGRLWIRNYNRILEYDPVANTYQARTSQDAGIPDGYKLALDPTRRRLIMIGGGVVYSYDVSLTGTIPQTLLSTTGGSAILNTKAGCEYDPVSGRFVAWDGGGDVYTLDFDTRVWTRRAATGPVIPTAAPGQGTFGRWRYSPSKNVFVAVNSIDENVYVYRLASATSTAPTVSVAATDASASEPGSNTGTFPVTRAGSTAGALAVSYSVSGTASAGSDYSALSGTVTIADGSASASVLVTPVNDSAPESSETVTITLTPGAGYTVGAPSAATVAIADDDSAPPADTDGDGLTDADETNLFGTNPNNPDTDADGMSDGVEVAAGFNPLVADQDGSGLPDGQDDWDGDGTINQSDPTPGSPPAAASSSDGDGGACGATGLEALLLAALLGIGGRRSGRGGTRSPASP